MPPRGQFSTGVDSIGQIGEVIGAVEDVAEDETEADSTLAEKRVEEAHDIIHRVAAILAMEEEDAGGDGSDGGGGGEDGNEGGEEVSTDEATTAVVGADTGPVNDGLLKEVPWDGKLDGETIELAEDEEG